MFAETQARLISTALDSIKRGVATKTTLPILQNVHLAAERGPFMDRIVLTVTNLECAMRAYVPASVSDIGAWTVPYATLRDWLAIEPNDDIVTVSNGVSVGSVAIAGERTYAMDREIAARRTARECVTVTQARNRCTIRGIDADDFPIMPTADSGAVIGSVRAGELARIIGETHKFAATNDSRPIFAGIHLTSLSNDDWSEHVGYLTATASDGSYTVSQAFCELDESQASPDARTDLVIPARVAAGMLPILKESSPDTLVTISASGNHLFLSFDGAELVSRLMDGQFPIAALRSELIEDRRAVIEIPRLDLAKVLRRSLAMAGSEPGINPTARDKKEVTVTFLASGDMLTVETGSEGKSQSDSVPAHIIGTLPRYSFNAKQIGDTLRSYSAKNLALYVGSDGIKFTAHNARSPEGNRLVTRVYTDVERTRREYRKVGACSPWSAHKIGASSTLAYSYQRLENEPEVLTVNIRKACERELARYTSDMAALDAVMADAWEGYREPAYIRIDTYGDAKNAAALARALECYPACGEPKPQRIDFDTFSLREYEIAVANWQRAEDAAQSALAGEPEIEPEIEPETIEPAMRRAMWNETADGSLVLNADFVAEYAAFQAAQTSERASDSEPEYDYHAAECRKDVVTVAIWGHAPRAVAVDVRPYPEQLMIAARSIDNRSRMPYGLPIPDDCSPANAIERWQVYCQICRAATRVRERQLADDMPYVYDFGPNLAIHYYPAHLLHNPQNGAVYPYREQWTLARKYRNGEDRVTNYSDHCSLESAYRAALDSIPGRAATPPGYCGPITPCSEPATMFTSEYGSIAPYSGSTADDLQAWHAARTRAAMLPPTEPREPYGMFETFMTALTQARRQGYPAPHARRIAVASLLGAWNTPEECERVRAIYRTAGSHVRSHNHAYRVRA